MRCLVQILAICVLPAALSACRHASPLNVATVDPVPLPGNRTPADGPFKPRTLTANFDIPPEVDHQAIPQLPASGAPAIRSAVASFSSRDHEPAAASRVAGSGLRAGLNSLFSESEPPQDVEIQLTEYNDESDGLTIDELSAMERADPALQTGSLSNDSTAASFTLAQLEQLAATHNPTLSDGQCHCAEGDGCKAADWTLPESHCRLPG